MARPGDPSESLQSEQVGEDSRESRRSIWSRLSLKVEKRGTGRRDRHTSSLVVVGRELVFVVVLCC